MKKKNKTKKIIGILAIFGFIALVGLNFQTITNPESTCKTTSDCASVWHYEGRLGDAMLTNPFCYDGTCTYRECVSGCTESVCKWTYCDEGICGDGVCSEGEDCIIDCGSGCTDGSLRNQHCEGEEIWGEQCNDGEWNKLIIRNCISYYGDDFICSNAECVRCNEDNPECSSDSDCGRDGFIGTPVCDNDGNIYSDYRDYECENGRCVDSVKEDRLYEECFAENGLDLGCSGSQCNDVNYDRTKYCRTIGDEHSFVKVSLVCINDNLLYNCVKDKAVDCDKITGHAESFCKLSNTITSGTGSGDYCDYRGTAYVPDDDDDGVVVTTSTTLYDNPDDCPEGTHFYAGECIIIGDGPAGECNNDEDCMNIYEDCYKICYQGTCASTNAEDKPCNGATFQGYPVCEWDKTTCNGDITNDVSVVLLDMKLMDWLVIGGVVFFVLLIGAMLVMKR